MTPLFKLITENNFFRHKLLKNIFFASLLVAIALPVYTLYFVFPSFNRLLIEIYSDHSVRSASHLASIFLSGTGEITRESISAKFLGDSQKVIKDLGLAKYKIFSPTGVVVHYRDHPDKRKPVYPFAAAD